MRRGRRILGGCVLGLGVAVGPADAQTTGTESWQFALTAYGITGNWSDLRAGAAWMFSNHFGVGVGYERFVTHVDVSKLSFTGRLNFGYQGLLIYVRGGF